MKNNGKVILLFTLGLGLIVFAFILTQQNSENLQGNIQIQTGNESELVNQESNLLPDLSVEASVIGVEEGNEDVVVEVKIKNIGEIALTSPNKLSYQVLINKTSVLENTDTFTSMEINEESSFQYPIPKSIYNYPDSGEITVIIDPNNEVQELNESNNQIVLVY